MSTKKGITPKSTKKVIVEESSSESSEEESEIEETENVDDDVVDDDSDDEEIEEEEEKGDKKKKDDEDDEGDDDDYNLDVVKDISKKSCFYKKTKGDKSGESSEDDGDDKIFEFDDDDDLIKDVMVVDEKERISKRVLTKYERVRILSQRCTQLNLGAKPLIQNTDGLSSREIAELEIKHNVIPLIIRRTLPDGKYEKFYIRELQHE